MTENTYTDGADLTLEADERITVAGGVILSTRNLGDVNAEDHLEAYSQGSSGNLVLRAPNIEVKSGAKLLAHAKNTEGPGGTSYTGGEIKLIAERTLHVPAAQAKTRIALSGATLKGRAITLSATSEGQFFWDGEENIPIEVVSAVGAAILGFSAGVARARAAAEVIVGANTVLEAEETLTLKSDGRRPRRLTSLRAGRQGARPGRARGRAPRSRPRRPWP